MPSMNTLLCGLLLLGTSGMALAQAGPGASYGNVGGMHAGNTRACGLAPAQVEKLRKLHKGQARQVIGTTANFEAGYDAAAAQSEQRIVQAWKQGQYTPDAEVCAELKRQAGG